MKKEEIAKMIDHTLLKPEATEEQVKVLCGEAKNYHFASVCVNPVHVALAANLLKETDVKVCTVIGFPLGANTSAVKAFEASEAIKEGALEVDMVINVGKLKDKNYEYVKADIEAVVKASKGKALTKVILETCLLSDDEKVAACKLAKEAGADFVKTSTGFNKSGATEADIMLMRTTVGENMGVKASGGVRNNSDAISLIKAGASRIGASSSIAICEGKEGNSNY